MKYKQLTLYAVFVASFLLYLPAANGPYLVDDYANLLNNEHLVLEQLDSESLVNAATSSHTGGIGRPLSMLSFALNYTLAGDKDVYPVKLVNIILHIITGAGIFMLLKLLLTQWMRSDPANTYWTALLVTTLWLLHPLQVSTVLYSVQRMTMLSALFTVFGLIAYMKYRLDTLRTNSHFLTLLVVVSCLTLLGVLSKENAALLPLFALLIEVTVFRFEFHPETSILRKALVKSMLYVPLLAISAYLVYSYFNVRGGIIWPYTFDIDQRLLTQPRILMHYLGWILLINPEPMSLHHTDIGLSSGMLIPITTLPSIVMLFFLAVSAWFSLRKQRYPVFGFGIMWFLIGHLLESTTIPLELMYEHRNYLPSLGILLIPAYVLVHTLDTVSRNRHSRIWFCTAIILLTASLTHERISVWRDEKSLILDQLSKKSEVAWSWADAASYLSRAGNPVAAIDSMRTAARLDPDEPAFIFGEAYIRCQHRPDLEFPEEFRLSLVSSLEDKPLTPTSINSLVGMINTCHSSNVNDGILRELYREATKHKRVTVAEIGRNALENLDSKSTRN